MYGPVDRGVDDLALAPPHPDQRQQAEALRVQVGAFAQVGGVVGDRQVVEARPVALRRVGRGVGGGRLGHSSTVRPSAGGVVNSRRSR